MSVAHIERNALVYYSPAEMYELVVNIDDYENFLPWCKSSTVLENNGNTMTASVEIAKGILDKTFTTRNTNTLNQCIEMQLVDGPFKQLHGYWRFSALKTDNACKVSLELDFEFDSALVSLAARPIFTKIANSLVDSFCKRAVEIYGERG